MKRKNANVHAGATVEVVASNSVTSFGGSTAKRDYESPALTVELRSQNANKTAEFLASMPLFAIPHVSKSVSDPARIIRNCRLCSKPFSPSYSAIRKGMGFYCSPSCRSKNRRPVCTSFSTPPSTKRERIAANGLINMRIRRGWFERPKQCDNCGKKKRTDAHHPDYSQPNLVAFLCRSCHMKAHHNADFEKAVAAKAREAHPRVMGSVSLPQSRPEKGRGA